jgi:caa(3)-type oxidase subunit IV
MSILARELRDRLRTPAIVWLSLVVLLGIISAIGVVAPHGSWWIIEAVCLAIMISLVIVFSMELARHKPIVRLFSFLGFFWASILFGMIMIDYLTR